MNLPVRLKHTNEPEWMDAPGQDPVALAGNLDDLRRINRWLGGAHMTIRAVGRIMGDLRAGNELVVLDVAAGGADIPSAILTWARRRGVRPTVVATDISYDILALARRRAAADLTSPLPMGAACPSSATGSTSSPAPCHCIICRQTTRWPCCGRWGGSRGAG